MKSRVKLKSRGKRKAVRAKSTAKTSTKTANKTKSKAKMLPARKTAKPRAAAKAAQSAKAAKPARPSGSAKSAKASAPKLRPLDQWIMVAAANLGVPVKTPWMQAVRTNLQVTLDQGAAVADFPLPDDAEPAPVFRA